MTSAGTTIRCLVGAIMLFAAGLGAIAGPLEDMADADRAYSLGDVTAAIRSYRKAADAGHAPAQVRLGYIYDKSEFNEEAVRWFRRAAEQGNAEGQYYLGEMYSMGEGVARDYNLGIEWILKAAEQELPIAMKVLAKRYEQGVLGLTKDPQQSLRWWQRAAEQGDGEAISRLARAYRGGELGLAADPQKAKMWESRIRPVAPVKPAPR